MGKSEKIILLILAGQILVNLLGALGPELSFDALWYHLTLPKLYLAEQKIFHVPGGLLYYSDMPKLIEMLYIPALAIGDEIFAKLIHFSFGIGCLVVIYKLSRKFVSAKFSLLACLIFYSNLVVGWMSTTAYIDLGRTFFEILALYYFIDRSYNRSALMIGLAISSKLLAVGSLFVFIIILIINKIKAVNIIKFVTITLLISLPWFIFSYLNTGNPFYPFFSNLYHVGVDFKLGNILNFIYCPDPISPIYLISLPIILIVYKKFGKDEKIIALYSFLAFIVLFVSPQSGGGRFIMAYLPAFSILVVITLSKIKTGFIKNYIIIIIIFITIINIIYRGVANAKFVPVVFGFESKDRFLTENLNFSFGDFYDIDGYFKKNIKAQDRVLIYGIHNLYYVDFPFIHESWLQKDDKFNYILVQNHELPTKFRGWRKVYENSITHVRLYYRTQY